MTTMPNGVLMFGNVTDECLQLVRNAGAEGVTAKEICELTGAAQNRVTAALHHLHAESCVRREMQPCAGSRAQYRYWYLHDRPPYGEGKRGPAVKAAAAKRRHREPHKRDVLIMIPVGNRDTIPLDFDQARTVYKVLHEIFGDRE